MIPEKSREIAEKVINKVKWWDMLSRFIDVLRINIHVVDSQGAVILPPEEDRYGGKLLTDKSFKFFETTNQGDFIKNFHPQGKYLESVSRNGLHCYAIAIQAENQLIAYMIVGPLILNKKMENEQYEKLAKEVGISGKDLLDQVNEIRVVSHLMINSILDLLAEIVKDSVELSIREPKTQQYANKEKGVLPKGINEVAKDIALTVRLDELLVTMLDVALKMTNTEFGSIMVIDEENGDLTIKAAKGLDKTRIAETRVKIGEGIAGLAVKENSPFIITGQEVKGEGGDRLGHLLKRPDIKHSLILPLVAKNRVFGVLNLHTKKEDSKIEDNFDNLQYLSKLLSSAF